MIMPASDVGPIRLLNRLEPFVVAPWWRFDALNLKPLGIEIRPEARFNILGTRAARFLARLVRLDRLTFGPEGMPMPEWLFVDGSALPGVITGLGIRADEIPLPARKRLGIDASPSELIPLAMYIAVPTRPPSVWYGHNLASLNRQLPDLRLSGLATLTKALGLCVMRCRTQLGATQWTSAALHVHTRFGPLELLTAWTPAHANPATLTYRLRLTPEIINAVAHGQATVTDDYERTWLHPSDEEAMQHLELMIEQKQQFAIVGPPDAAGRVPVARFNHRPEA